MLVWQRITTNGLPVAYRLMSEVRYNHGGPGHLGQPNIYGAH